MKPTAIIGYDYLWSGEQLIEETPVYADGTVGYEQSIHWLYEPGALTPSARFEKGQLYYVVSDHQGTVREILTEAGELIWAGRLLTWGEPERWPVLTVNDPRNLTCNLLFCGQYEDSESGLCYNRFRYYDNETGQYLSTDPLNLRGGVSPYSYVHNPANWIDPLGLAGCPISDSKSSSENKSFSHQGPELPKNIAETFKDGIYKNRQLTGDEVFYKYHGINNRTGRKFSWLTNKKYSSEDVLRQDLAIRHDWGVNITKISEFKVPRGTWVSEGPAAAQGSGYLGSGYQAVVTNLPKTWVQKTTGVP